MPLCLWVALAGQCGSRLRKRLRQLCFHWHRPRPRPSRRDGSVVARRHRHAPVTPAWDESNPGAVHLHWRICCRCRRAAWCQWAVYILGLARQGLSAIAC
eukprot:5007761-Amphidinium_carterae.1